MARRDEVVLVDTVPSVMAELVATRSLPRSTRYVVLGGERLTRDLARQIYELGHVDAVIDGYGPTETTVAAIFATRDRGKDGAETIGRPIANTRVYLLDEYAEPVPLGAVGEVHIGGVGVARGYLNRPELTAERFVADPFSRDPGARFVHLDELGGDRRSQPGVVEFRGRDCTHGVDDVAIGRSRVEAHPGDRSTVPDGFDSIRIRHGRRAVRRHDCSHAAAAVVARRSAKLTCGARPYRR
jgi:non-ribosomal peptide synthetase component F